MRRYSFGYVCTYIEIYAHIQKQISINICMDIHIYRYVYTIHVHIYMYVSSSVCIYIIYIIRTSMCIWEPRYPGPACAFNNGDICTIERIDGLFFAPKISPDQWIPLRAAVPATGLL